jgi:hypothetical protein
MDSYDPNSHTMAHMTSLNIFHCEGSRIYGVLDGFQAFLNLGFMGALITTTLGSISWKLVASAFPLGFLSNPLVYVFLRIWLGLEATDVLNGACVLAAIQAKACGFQHDEVCIDTAEDRAEKQKGDGDSDVGPGHPRKLPAFCDNAPDEIKELMELDADIAAYCTWSRFMNRSRMLPMSRPIESNRALQTKRVNDFICHVCCLKKE